MTAAASDLAPDTIHIGAIYDSTAGLLAAVQGGYEHGGYWDGIASPTDLTAAGDQLADVVSGCCRLAPGDRVLDVGCGTGKTAERLVRHSGVSVTGITVSHREAELAARRAARLSQDRAAGTGTLEFEIADMRSLPYADGEFDAAIAIESICHLTDRTPAFAEIGRVLRPGGRLVATDFVLRQEVTDPVHRRIVETSVRNFGTGPILTVEQYRQVLEAGGLEVVELTDIGEQVRPSWDAVADAGLALGHEAAGFDSAEDYRAMFEAIRDFGAVTEIGYLLVVAARPAERAVPAPTSEAGRTGMQP